MFGAILVILAQICDELWRRQAEFPSILSQNSQNDLEGQGQWPPFPIPAESNPGCMFGANLVYHLKSETSYRADEVNITDRRTDIRTDRRTDADNDNTPSAWKVKG